MSPPKTLRKRVSVERKKDPWVFTLLASLLISAPLALGAVPWWAQAMVGLEVVALWVLILIRHSEMMVAGKLNLPPTYVLILIFIGLGWGAGSALWSVYPYETIRHSFLLLTCVALFLGVFLLIRDFEEVESMLLLLLAIAVGVSLLGYIRDYLGIWPSDRPGLAGPFGNHNHFAGYLELVIPAGLFLGIFLIRRGDQPWKIVYCLGAALFLGVTLVLTRSRAGILSFGVALVVAAAFAMRLRRTIQIRMLTLGIGALFVGLVGFALRFKLMELANSLLHRTTLFRFLLWETAWKAIAAKPIFGHGLGTFGYVSSQFRPPTVQHFVNYAHQEYLQGFAELGVLGLGLTVAIGFGLPFFLFSRLRYQQRSLALGVGFASATALLSLGIHGLYDFNYHIPANLFYGSVLLALAFRALKLEETVVIIPHARRWVAGSMLMIALFWCHVGIADAFSWMGKGLEKRKSFALTAFQRAVAFNPWDAQYRNQLGGTYLDQREMEEAKRHFQRAVRLNTHLPNSFYHLALIETVSGTPDMARTYFEAAIRLDPNEPKKVVDYVRWLIGQNQPLAGLLYCRDLCQRVAGGLEPCLESFRNTQLSLSELTTMISDDAYSRTVFARFLLQQRESHALWLWSRDLNRQYPPTPQSIFLLAQASWLMGYREEAQKFAEQGLQFFPFEDEMLVLLANIHLKQGSFEQAFGLYAERLALPDAEPTWLDRILEMAYAANQPLAAEKVLAENVRRRPKWIHAQERFAEYAVRTGDLHRAIQIYMELLVKGSDPLRYRQILAVLHGQNGHYREAIAQWEEIIKREPKHVDALVALGDLYEKIADRAQAIAYFQRALQVDPLRGGLKERIEALERERKGIQ